MNYFRHVAALLPIALSLLAGCTPAANDVQKEAAVTSELAQTLLTSDDPWELNDAAKALAKGKEPADLVAVGKALSSDRFLSHLDSAKDYEGDSRHLRLAAIIKALAENGSPPAQEVLLATTESPVFVDHPSRVELLIDALTFIRPSPPRAITFWDRHSQPEDGFVERTVGQIAENGSAPAVKLLEKKLTSSDFEEEDREWWIRRHVLGLRDNPAMLAACERMFAGSLEPQLRPRLAEVLFDYQVKAWYRPHDIPDCPSRAEATPQALEALRRIGTNALKNLDLGPTLEAKVKAELQVIDERLK